MSAQTGEEKQVQFGQLREPRMPGIAGLPASASVVLIGGAALLMLLLAFQLLIAAVFWTLLVLAAVAPAALKTADGYTRYTVMWRRIKHGRAQRAGTTLLRQGMTGHVPDGRCSLPGLAAANELSSHRDVHGRGFGMVSWPHSHLHTVVIQCYPPGLDGLDKQVVDSQVAHWGAWMGQLNQMGPVAGAAVTVETAPDSGQRLRRAMQRGVAQDAPEFSTVLSEQIQEAAGTGSPTVSVWVTVTFSGKAAGDDAGAEAQSADEVAAQIGDVLPTLTGTLDQTGAGTGSRPCTAQEITDHTRVAFDPGVAPLVEEAQFAGGTGLTWDQAGPIAAENRYDHYVHEGAVSRSWQMREGPRGTFFAQTLQGMISPHKDVDRKRVTLVYRPESPEASARAAEADVTKAMLKESQRKRARHADSLQVQAARKTAEQEAMGSPLVRIGLVATVTVLDPADLRRATRAVVRGLAPQARLRLRVPKASQDVAFLAGLPLGMVVPEHLRVPASVRETL